MTDKEFDDILKDKLDQFDEAYDPASWERLERRIEDEGLTEDSDFDEAIRAAMAGFAGVESMPDWDAMEEKLNADQAMAFDAEVKGKVADYKAPYDPASWPLLSVKITEDERMRRKLIGAKILEVAAVLIAIVTLFNFLPVLEKAISTDREAVMITDEESTSASSESSTEEQSVVGSSLAAENSNAVTANHIGEVHLVAGNAEVNTATSQAAALEAQDGEASDADRRSVSAFTAIPSSQSEVRHDLLGQSARWHEVEPDMRASLMSGKVATLGLPEAVNGDVNFNLPPSQLPSRGKSFRVGISTSLDVNRLHMPSDQFYADGRKIKFSEKDLIATGYALGATVILDRGKWSFETGLQYSLKSFEPNRVLQIGKTFDVRTVDFEEISMHVVSVPLNAFWNFDRRGKTRFYALGGLGFNIITTANYDLLTRRNIGSQPPGGSRTDFEVARVREHFLDGAEFSSKAFITASAGFGVDHHLNKKISIFAQPTYNYQVPFFVFSDKEGKHIQYLSMQVGTRIRLK